MAKISANGDRELARWRKGRESAKGAPYEMVLTEKGRLLYKGTRQSGFTLRRRGVSVQTAAAQAAMFGMEQVGGARVMKLTPTDAPESIVGRVLRGEGTS